MVSLIAATPTGEFSFAKGGMGMTRDKWPLHQLDKMSRKAKIIEWHK